MTEVTCDITFTLNGAPVSLRVGGHENMVDALKRLGLSGARESCGQGLCGCCTVIIDGVAESGCLTLAQLVDGRSVQTIEGLDADGALSPVQQAFIDAGALQCGFCAPGFVLMSHQLLAANPDPSEEEIRNYLSGNLCRCAAYPEIIKAVRLAASRMRAAKAA